MSIIRRLDVQIVFALFVLCFFVGCGGGGGDTAAPSPSPVITTATITGTVAGTTIVAYNATTGAEVARGVASGTPKNFTLSLPTGVSYKIYLLENEGTANQRIYPLYQGTTNVFAIGSSSNVTINLGYVNTTSGVAVPTNNPLNVSGVTSGGANTTIPIDIASSAFALSDLSGSWSYQGLKCGAAGQWYYGSANFDNAGTVTFPTDRITSSGPRTTSSQVFSITSSGLVSVPAFTEIMFHGLMSVDKSLLIATHTSDTGVYDLGIWQKSGATFTTADLSGTWNFHGLWAGSSAGWYYGVANITSGGAVTYPNQTTTSTGPSTSSSHYFSITSAGITTVPSDTSYWHGVMSSDKSLMISTRFLSATAYTLQVWQKSGATFSESDMQGTWKFTALTSGTDFAWQGWVYGRATISGSNMTWSDIIARGAASSSFSGSISITPDGIITPLNADQGLFHAVMSNDKRMMIATMNDGGGGYTMVILQR